MELLQLFVFLFLIPVAPFVVIDLLGSHRREATLQELAARMGLKYKPAIYSIFSGKTPAYVTGSYRNRQFVLSVARRRWKWTGRVPLYSVRRIEVMVKNESDFKLVLRNAAHEAILLKRFVGKRGIQSGDEQFDRQFFIETSTPRSLAASLFAASDMRQNLINVMGGSLRRRIELNGQRLKLEETLPWYYIKRSSDQADYSQRIIDQMVDLAEVLDGITLHGAG